MSTISQKAQKTLAELRQAVADGLERKRRLGHYRLSGVMLDRWRSVNLHQPTPPRISQHGGKLILTTVR